MVRLPLSITYYLLNFFYILLFYALTTPLKIRQTKPYEFRAFVMITVHLNRHIPLLEEKERSLLRPVAGLPDTTTDFFRNSKCETTSCVHNDTNSRSGQSIARYCKDVTTSHLTFSSARPHITMRHFRSAILT